MWFESFWIYPVDGVSEQVADIKMYYAVLTSSDWMLSAKEVNNLNLICAVDQSGESFSPDNMSIVLDAIENG